MIVVRIYGGLGNQMFQYAFGLAAAKSNSTSFYLDIREFEESYDKNTKRIFELDKLEINSLVATDEIKNLFKLSNNSALFKVFRKIQNKLPQGMLGYYKERSFSYDSQFLSKINDAYFDGYWQSYRYFSKYRDEILTEFTPRVINEQNNLISKEIFSSNSVSLHIRRGDYVSDEKTNSHHGACSLDYYYQAIKVLEESERKLRFYLFSDDPEWVKKNLEINHPVEVIDFNGSKNAHLDMYLMSLCKSHIIANSSFSWWGAWLSKSENKKVFAPKKWFQTDVDTSDLIPEEWVRL